jgi:hypothetical protein
MKNRLSLSLSLLLVMQSFSLAHGKTVQHHINVQWAKGSYARTVVFWLYRSSDRVNFSKLGATTSNTQTTWTDSSVLGGKTYSYYVTAFDTLTQEQSPPSKSVTQTVP